MRCPFCRADEKDRVIDSRPVEDGQSIRRRRQCDICHRRFTTYERVEETFRMTVVKKDGSRVPYERSKVLDGIQKACYKRPVAGELISKIVDAVEEEISQRFHREVPSNALGEAVMRHLRQIDPIAYVRFASVYRQFRDLGELMEDAQVAMQTDHRPAPGQQDLFARNAAPTASVPNAPTAPGVAAAKLSPESARKPVR